MPQPDSLRLLTDSKVSQYRMAAEVIIDAVLGRVQQWDVICPVNRSTRARPSILGTASSLHIPKGYQYIRAFTCRFLSCHTAC